MSVEIVLYNTIRGHRIIRDMFRQLYFPDLDIAEIADYKEDRADQCLVACAKKAISRGCSDLKIVSAPRNNRGASGWSIAEISGKESIISEATADDGWKYESDGEFM